ncbi:hypothetical protein PoB_007211900 [Plakobranchus ocellatus]|uniref:Uncharacterized protein n=1 Tax=Plakobranchus ocellatus TaxID=259542 RepID=A0AAV4DNQ0_9GAST|nr:hypothetical protein PoB_007211900 [Plakobranchus ocellatus]
MYKGVAFLLSSSSVVRVVNVYMCMFMSVYVYVYVCVKVVKTNHDINTNNNVDNRRNITADPWFCLPLFARSDREGDRKFNSQNATHPYFMSASECSRLLGQNGPTALTEPVLAQFTGVASFCTYKSIL